MQPNHSAVDNYALAVALSYQSRDLPIFPCRHADEYTGDFDHESGEEFVLKRKTPLTSNGLKGATINERIIRELWRRNPSAITGLVTGERSGFFVLDIDVKAGVNGFDWLNEMIAVNGDLPPTATATTPSGGKHFYFNYVPGTRNRGAMGLGADLRSEGGYVIAPGSVMDDGTFYAWDNHDGLEMPAIADAPAWLLDLIVRKDATLRDYGETPRVANNDRYVERAVQDELDDLANTPMGGRNNALNDSAFALGTFVGAGALSESEARGMLRDVAASWGRDLPRCLKTIDNGLQAGMRQPRHIPEPTQHHNDNTKLVDISRMIANGLAKGKTPQASVQEETAPRESAPVKSADAAESQAEPQGPITATAFKWKDPKTIPRREFAFGTHYIRKYVSVTVSPGGVGKTSLSIAESLSMTSGRALIGTKPKQPLNVWLFNAEDPRDELERRVMAACLHFKLKPADIEGRLFLDTGREQELVVAVDNKKTGVTIQEPIVEAVVEQIQRNKIDVMIIDPFVSTHSVNENDNGAIDKVAKLWAQIADYTNCAIDVVHHLKKLADKEATVEDARGAVSLIGAARSVRVLNRMTDDEATKASLEKEDRFSFFHIQYGKVNLTRMDSSKHWRKLESVPLGNGQGLMNPQDHAGVVTEWKWPSKDEIAQAVPDDVKAQVLVRLGNQNYRESAQSDDWAGYVLAEAMGIGLETGRTMTGDKRKVKTILDSWIENGILCIANEADPKHIDRKIKYVRPA